jgi:hypothetical protein
MYLPETRNYGALFVVRIGYDDGYNIFNLFRLETRFPSPFAAPNTMAGVLQR